MSTLTFTVPLSIKECVDVLSKELKLKFKPVEDGCLKVIVGAFFLYLFGILFLSPFVFSYFITIWSFSMFLSGVTFQYSPNLLLSAWLLSNTMTNDLMSSYFRGGTLMVMSMLALAWYLTRKLLHSIRVFIFLFLFLSLLSEHLIFNFMHDGINILTSLLSHSYFSFLRFEFTVFQLQLFMLFNTFNEISAFMVKLSLSSFIPLSVGLRLLHAGTKSISNVIEKHERGEINEYRTYVTLGTIKFVPLVFLMNPKFSITLKRKKKGGTEITIKVFSFYAFGIVGRSPHYRYSHHLTDEMSNIAYDIKVALERWYSSRLPGKPPSSDWLEGDLT